MVGQALESLGARLQARHRLVLKDERSRPAAVLVPLLGDLRDPDLLFFERSAQVLEHKGEICFPGGSLEPEDGGAVEAALREANEELGLLPHQVRVIGLLDDVATNVSNYTITPVVGHVTANPKLVPDRLEVARIVQVPLRHLLEPGVESEGFATITGTRKLRYTYTFDGNVVWGATARILHSLIELLT
jgi:8-oxo-dGTP pyrophosphatase MutT (NUDIX family)